MRRSDSLLTTVQILSKSVDLLRSGELKMSRDVTRLLTLLDASPARTTSVFLFLCLASVKIFLPRDARPAGMSNEEPTGLFVGRPITGFRLSFRQPTNQRCNVDFSFFFIFSIQNPKHTEWTLFDKFTRETILDTHSEVPHPT